MSRFFGIVIRRFFDEHPPPHFHAEYGDTRAVVGIQPIDVIESSLPPRGLSLVLEWAARNQQGLADDRERLREANRCGSCRRWSEAGERRCACA